MRFLSVVFASRKLDFQQVAKGLVEFRMLKYLFSSLFPYRVDHHRQKDKN